MFDLFKQGLVVKATSPETRGSSSTRAITGIETHSGLGFRMSHIGVGLNTAIHAPVLRLRCLRKEAGGVHHYSVE